MLGQESCDIPGPSILEVTALVFVPAIWFMMAIIAAAAMAWKNAAGDTEKSENAEQEKKWFHMFFVVK